MLDSYQAADNSLCFCVWSFWGGQFSKQWWWWCWLALTIVSIWCVWFQAGQTGRHTPFHPINDCHCLHFPFRFNNRTKQTVLPLASKSLQFVFVRLYATKKIIKNVNYYRTENVWFDTYLRQISYYSFHVWYGRTTCVNFIINLITYATQNCNI